MASFNDDIWDASPPWSPTRPELINIEGNPEAALLGRGLGTSTPFTQHDNAVIRGTARAISAIWLWIVSTIRRIVQSISLRREAISIATVALGFVLMCSAGFFIDWPHRDSVGLAQGFFLGGYFIIIMGVVVAMG